MEEPITNQKETKKCLRCGENITETYGEKFCSLRCARIFHIIKFQKKKYLEWKALGLCRKCGKIKENPDMKHCNKCLDIWRAYNLKKKVNHKPIINQETHNIIDINNERRLQT